MFRRPLALDADLAAPHIAVTIAGADISWAFGDEHLKRLKLDCRIEVVARSFAVLPFLVMGMQRLAIVRRRLAEVACRSLPVAHAPLPGSNSPMRMVMQFHAARDNDEGLRWLRNDAPRRAAR